MKPNNRQKKNLSFSNIKTKSKKKKYQKESEFVTVCFLGIRHRIDVRGYTCTTCLDR